MAASTQPLLAHEANGAANGTTTNGDGAATNGKADGGVSDDKTAAAGQEQRLQAAEEGLRPGLAGGRLSTRITAEAAEANMKRQTSGSRASRTAFRVQCVDQLRGFTMVIAVSTGARGSLYDSLAPLQVPWMPQLAHAAWIGCTAEDILIPFFHVTMGTGMSFMLKVGRYRREGEGKGANSDAASSSSGGLSLLQEAPPPTEAEILAEKKQDAQLWRDIIRRSFLLWIIGLFLQGRIFFFSIFSGPKLFFSQFLDSDLRSYILNQIRVTGVLERYGIVYFFIAVLLLGFRNRKEVVIPKELSVGAREKGLLFWIRSCLRAQAQVIYMILPVWCVVLTLCLVCTFVKNEVNGAHAGLSPADRMPASSLLPIVGLVPGATFNPPPIPGASPTLPPPTNDLAPTDCVPGDWKDKPGPDRCNVLPILDKAIYGCNHLYDPVNCFDPESMLSIGTVNLNLMLGLHAGLLVKYAKEARFDTPRSLHTFMLLNYFLLFWLCVGLGHLLSVYDSPLIKQMWTPSFAMYSGAVAFFFLIMFYALNDIWRSAREAELEQEKKAAPGSLPPRAGLQVLSDGILFALRDYVFLPFYWIGRNAILSWVIFNKLPDQYLCEWWAGDLNFTVLGSDVVVCQDGVYAYAPCSLALASCVLHTVGLGLFMRWMFKRGTFIVL